MNLPRQVDLMCIAEVRTGRDELHQLAPAFSLLLSVLRWLSAREPTDDADEDILDWIGERLAEAWLDRVSRLFPQRPFFCALVDDYGPTISLHQAG